jgi:hypothetical protein
MGNEIYLAKPAWLPASKSAALSPSDLPLGGPLPELGFLTQVRQVCSLFGEDRSPIFLPLFQESS